MKVSKWIRAAACASLALVAVFLGFGAAAKGPKASKGGGYHLIKTVKFDKAPGEVEYFDYINVDAAARRVYLCEGTRFIVVDADKGTIIGEVGGLKRGHGVALVPEVNRGFISDGNAAEIVMFDLQSLKPVGKIKGEEDADYIMYEPTTKHVFAFNGTAHSISVIDPKEGKVVGRIPLDGVPEQAVADGKGMIYDTVASTNEVVAIDAKAMKVVSHWPVAPSGQPTTMAMDRAHRRLFVGGRGPKVMVMMDADSGKVLGGWPIGDRVDTGIFDPKSGMIAQATREGTLHIFHEDSPDKVSVTEAVQTQFGAKTMGFDPKTHNLYLTTSDFGPAPAPTAQQPNPQPVATPGTFRLLIYGR